MSMEKRITVRMDEELYLWLMANGGADTARRILEKAKEKLSGR